MIDQSTLANALTNIIFNLQMLTKWYSSLSNRTIAITIVLCVCMLYFSYTFNSCLVSKIHRTFKPVSKMRKLRNSLTNSSVYL